MVLMVHLDGYRHGWDRLQRMRGERKSRQRLLKRALRASRGWYVACPWRKKFMTVDSFLASRLIGQRERKRLGNSYRSLGPPSLGRSKHSDFASAYQKLPGRSMTISAAHLNKRYRCRIGKLRALNSAICLDKWPVMTYATRKSLYAQLSLPFLTVSSRLKHSLPINLLTNVAIWNMHQKHINTIRSLLGLHCRSRKYCRDALVVSARLSVRRVPVLAD